MQQSGRYVPVHTAGFALITVCFGLFNLGPASPAFVLVTSQIVYAAGAGLAIGTLLPAIQAKLSEADTATASGTWAVMRSFGTIWGVTVAAVIFNNRFSQLSGRISDEATRAKLSGGNAYEHASSYFLASLATRPDLQAEVVSCYTDSLRLAWQVAISLAGLGFLLVFVQRQVTLRTHLETDYGMRQTHSGDKESFHGEVVV